MDNKKAGILGIVSFVSAGIIIVLFLAGWVYFFNTMTSVMDNIPSTTAVNITDAVSKTIDPVNNAMSGLNYISFILIIMLGISTLIECYYIKRHPILFIVHIFIVIAAVLASIYIANQYESLMSSSILSSYIMQHKGASWIILNLPYVTAIIGVVGIIIMMINLNKDPQLRSDSI